MQSLLLAALLSASPSTETCSLPPRSEVSTLKADAQALFKEGNTAGAAELWLRAMRLYPSCVRTYGPRRDLAIRALNALAKSPDPGTPCGSPALQAARLVRQTHAELMALPGKSAGLNAARADFSDRLSRLSKTASDTAAFLDPMVAPLPAAVVFDLHSGAVATFGSCPELRSTLTRHVLAAIPADLPVPPACDSRSEKARQILRQAMAALRSAEPGIETSTPEYAALTQRLATIDAEGSRLSAMRVQAKAEVDPDRAAEAWAGLARELPTCSAYLAAKHDATVAAVTAWQKKGEHGETPAERYNSSKGLLDAVIKSIEHVFGSGAVKLHEHESLVRSRATLVYPRTTKTERLASPIAVPAPATTQTAAGHVHRGQWISLHRPEGNMIELGVITGVMAPSSGLFGEGAGRHQLFDAYQQRESIESINNGSGGEMFWKPYRKAAPEIGLRFAWYPLSLLGIEAEGGVMPTRIVVDGTPAARATLYSFRGHFIGQLPLWRITPFVLIGGGMLGTTGALGGDIDPTLNIGGGVKFYFSHRLMLRLDLRDTLGAGLGIGSGATHYPEVLLGLSLTLNRRKGRRSSPPNSSSKSAGAR